MAQINEKQILNVDELLTTHLEVLTYLLTGRSFEWIKNKLIGVFRDFKYLEIMSQGRLLSFDKNNVLIGAYPISPFKTNFKVQIEGIGTGYSMCAVDALGVAYTFNAKTIIDTFDKATNSPIQIIIDPTLNTQENHNLFVSYPPAACNTGDRSNIVSAVDVCPTIDFYSLPETIPDEANLKYMSFEQALFSAKEQFSQDALKECIKQDINRSKTGIISQNDCNC